MNFYQVFAADVGIDLRGDDIGVPQEDLDAAEVGAALEEVGGETVPEGVWMDLSQAGLKRVRLDLLPDGLPADVFLPSPARKNPLRKPALEKKRPGLLQVKVQPVDGFLAQGRQALM